MEGRAQRLAYCQARKDWLPDKEWANISLTDEMSVEIGGSFGVSQVWRGNDENWDHLYLSNDEALPNSDVNHYRYYLPVSGLIRCRVLSTSGAPRQTKGGKKPFARLLFSTVRSTFGESIERHIEDHRGMERTSGTRASSWKADAKLAGTLQERRLAAIKARSSN